MEARSCTRLEMFLAVKAVCNARPQVWRHSDNFAEAFNDFCASLEKIRRLLSAADIFHSMSKGIALEMAVAETILTTELDELIEQFEPVDVAFVDEYTSARSKEIADDPFTMARFPDNICRRRP